MNDSEKLAEILERNRVSTRLWGDAKRAKDQAKEAKDAAEDFDAETRRVLAGFDEEYPLFDAPGADAPAATFSDAEMAALMDAAEERQAQAGAMLAESFPAPAPAREPAADAEFGVYLGKGTHPFEVIRAPSLKAAAAEAKGRHGPKVKVAYLGGEDPDGPGPGPKPKRARPRAAAKGGVA